MCDLNYVLSWALPLQTEHAEECEQPHLFLLQETCENMISLLSICCRTCGKMFQQQTISRDGEKQFHTNIVYGTLISGQTYGTVADFFSSLDHGMLTKVVFYKTEQEMDNVLETAVNNSMSRALEEERQIAIQEGRIDEDGYGHITVECDGGYCKRSYGTQYNAASCCGITVAEETGKVVRQEVMNKNCSLCANATKTGIPIEHKCYKNFEGPSSNMESEAVVKGFDETLEHGVKMTSIITDGDSKTFNKIKEECSYGTEITRDLCANHAVKATINRLKKLTTGKQRSTAKRLLKQHLFRIGKGLRSAIEYCAKHQESVETLRKDLRNVPCHVFGDHNNCRDYFCPQEKRNNQDRNDLDVMRNDQLYIEIRREVEVLAVKAESLQRGKTSNRAECFFSVLVKFIGGKRIYLSGRGSYYRRAKLAALLYNEGYYYHKFIFGELVGRQPGETFENYMEKRELERLRTGSRKKQRVPSATNAAEGDYLAEGDQELECVLPEEVTELKAKYTVIIKTMILHF